MAGHDGCGMQPIRWNSLPHDEIRTENPCPPCRPTLESEHLCLARANRFLCGVTRCSRTINPALSTLPHPPHPLAPSSSSSPRQWPRAGGCGRPAVARARGRTRMRIPLSAHVRSLAPLPSASPAVSLSLSPLERFSDTKIIHFEGRSLNLVTHVGAGEVVRYVEEEDEEGVTRCRCRRLHEMHLIL